MLRGRWRAFHGRRRSGIGRLFLGGLERDMHNFTHPDTNVLSLVIGDDTKSHARLMGRLGRDSNLHGRSGRKFLLEPFPDQIMRKLGEARAQPDGILFQIHIVDGPGHGNRIAHVINMRNGFLLVIPWPGGNGKIDSGCFGVHDVDAMGLARRDLRDTLPGTHKTNPVLSVEVGREQEMRLRQAEISRFFPALPAVVGIPDGYIRMQVFLLPLGMRDKEHLISRIVNGDVVPNFSLGL